MNAMVIAAFANFILGSGLFDQIKTAVMNAEDKLKDGAKKKKDVLSQLEVIGVAAGSSLINLGIELAVAWVKAKSGK